MRTANFKVSPAAHDAGVELLSEYVVSDPEIMGGEPVIKGTRVLAHTVMARLEGGDLMDDLIAEYGGLISREAFTDALDYAKANPLPKNPVRILR